MAMIGSRDGGFEWSVTKKYVPITPRTIPPQNNALDFPVETNRGLCMALSLEVERGEPVDPQSTDDEQG